MKFAINCY